MMRGSRVVRYSGLIVSFAALAVGCSSPTEVSESARLGFEIATSPEIAKLGFSRDWVTIVYRNAAGTDTITAADFSGDPRQGATDNFPVPPGTMGIHIDIAPQDKVVGTADLVLSVDEGDLWIVGFSFGFKPALCIGCKSLKEVPFQESLLGLQSFWILQFEGRVTPPGEIPNPS